MYVCFNVPFYLCFQKQENPCNNCKKKRKLSDCLVWEIEPFCKCLDQFSLVALGKSIVAKSSLSYLLVTKLQLSGIHSEQG